MSLLVRFVGMSDIGVIEVVPKSNSESQDLRGDSLVNGEYKAESSKCSKKDGLVLDGLRKLQSKVLGVVGGILWFVCGEGNTLIRLEEEDSVKLSHRTKADKDTLPVFDSIRETNSTMSIQSPPSLMKVRAFTNILRRVPQTPPCRI
jgi:hypothetical protein